MAEIKNIPAEAQILIERFGASVVGSQLLCAYGLLDRQPEDWDLAVPAKYYNLAISFLTFRGWVNDIRSFTARYGTRQEPTNRFRKNDLVIDLFTGTFSSDLEKISETIRVKVELSQKSDLDDSVKNHHKSDLQDIFSRL